MTEIRYYDYDGVPCRVLIEKSGRQMTAEGYFSGKGFRPVALFPVLRRGQMLTEQEFRSFVGNLRRK